MSILKQQKLYQLLQDNNLQLSLADFIEFTFHQMENDYLSISKIVEDIQTSRNYPLAESVEYNLPEFVGLLQQIGNGLAKAHKE
jgi:hypothetical protein